MEYYQMVVGRRGIDPCYFWSDMTHEEVSAIYKAQVEESRDQWERTRVVAYWSAAGMNKMPKMQDWMPFDWDNGVEKPKTKGKPSKERMNAIIKQING